MTPELMLDDWYRDDFAAEVAEYPMKSAQEHHQKDAHRIICRHCGGNQFTVCIIPGAYWTGIKCEACGWDDCIHSG